MIGPHWRSFGRPIGLKEQTKLAGCLHAHADPYGEGPSFVCLGADSPYDAFLLTTALR